MGGVEEKCHRKGVKLMEPISVDTFVHEHLRYVEGEKESDLRPRLEHAVAEKKAGAVCLNCGQPIWAIGSAIVEWNGCFTCITGESDSSGDYEIDEVCFS